MTMAASNRIGSMSKKSHAKEKENDDQNTHMHRQEPSFVDRFTGYVETAGRVYGAAQTLYHVGRAVGSAARCAAPLLALM